MVRRGGALIVDSALSQRLSSQTRYNHGYTRQRRSTGPVRLSRTSNASSVPRLSETAPTDKIGTAPALPASQTLCWRRCCRSEPGRSHPAVLTKGGGQGPCHNHSRSRHAERLWDQTDPLPTARLPQIGIPQSGNQRSNSGSIGSSELICALICSSRSVERCPPESPALPAPSAGTNGYQKPRL
jgi:hypothetical protein